MAALEWGTPAQYEEITAFADAVFGGQGGFKTLVPRIYDGNPEAARWHLLLRKQGEIQGLLLCAPGVMHVGHAAVPYSCIGTVAVAQKARGRGLMGTLLRQAEAAMRARGDVFAALGGQRQRYEHYGYRPAGLGLQTAVTQANLRHTNGGKTLDTAPYEAWLPQIRELHQAQPVWCARQSYPAALGAWGAEPVALLREGRFCGYAAVKEDENNITCTELLLADPGLAPAACAALMGTSDRLSLWIPLYNRPLAVAMAGFAEEYRIGTTHSFAVYDASRLAASLAPLQPGWNSGLQQALPEAGQTESLFGPLGLIQGHPALPLWLPAPDAC